MSEAPSDETMALFPHYLIMTEDRPPFADEGASDRVQAEFMAHMAAREKTGKYVVVYQRVVLVRKSA